MTFATESTTVGGFVASDNGVNDGVNAGASDWRKTKCHPIRSDLTYSHRYFRCNI